MSWLNAAKEMCHGMNIKNVFAIVTIITMTHPCLKTSVKAMLTYASSPAVVDSIPVSKSKEAVQKHSSGRVLQPPNYYSRS